ncbi:TonB-dependent receptor [Chitinophaga sp. Mgbs1]|uniref:TonB-dependent receptor n=1 Tax=Chitinophaga solisilvae TaxID=1233460 RepID=A0A3S1BJG8_9BACT|nr:TonB-dependent receptor [Chitinophaga solisilvae]
MKISFRFPCLLLLSFHCHTAFAQVSTRDTVKQLQAVTVSGNTAIIQKSDDKTVYRLSNSITAQGTDVLDAIGKIPGVKVGTDAIGLAGKGAVKIMINNRLMNLSGEDLMRYLKSLSASQVSKIEVITNPSARYETDGNAGLINIVLQHDKKQGYSGSLQLSSKLSAPGVSEAYGKKTFGELAGSGTINYNTGKWSAYGSVNVTKDRHLEGFGIDLQYPQKTWMQTDTGLYTFNNLSVVAGVDYKLSSRATIGVSYLGGKNNYKGADHVRNPVYDLSGKQQQLMTTYADYYPVAATNSFNIHSDITLDSSGKKLLLDADYFNYYRTDRSDFESNSYGADGKLQPNGRTRIYDDNKQHINVYTLKADADIPAKFAKYQVGGKLSFISNYSNAFYYDKANDDRLTLNRNLSNEFDYSENTQALYGSASKHISNWNLQAGLRGELTQTKGYSHTLQQTHRQQYLKLYPSVLIAFTPSNDHHYTFSVNKRVNRPTFWNLNPYKSLTTASSYLEGNPYLQPEYNTNIEASHTYREKFTTSVFYNITNNGFSNITFGQADTSLVFTRPLNYLETQRIGVSENVALTIGSWWESNQLLTVYHTNAHATRDDIHDISGYGCYVSTNNNFYFSKDKTLAGSLNFWCQFPEVTQIGRTNTYYRLDAGIKAMLFRKKATVTLTANDLLRSSAVAVSSHINGIPQTFYGFQINRFYQLSISYRFGANGDRQQKRSGNTEERGRI